MASHRRRLAPGAAVSGRATGGSRLKPLPRFRATRFAATLLAAACGVVACAGMPRSVDAPEVELVNVTLLGDQRFALTFLVSNADADPIPVEEIRYSVRLAGQGYLNGSQAGPLVIEASSRQTVRTELATDGVSSASRLLALVSGPDDALEYELSGDLVLGGRPPRLVAFTYSGEVPLRVSAD